MDKIKNGDVVYWLESNKLISSGIVEHTKELYSFIRLKNGFNVIKANIDLHLNKESLI